MEKETQNFNLGANLLRIRLEKNLTQAQLGEKVDVSGAQIGRYEKGKDNISNAMLSMLCEALEVSEIEMRGLNKEGKHTQAKKVGIPENISPEKYMDKLELLTEYQEEKIKRLEKELADLRRKT